MTNIKPKYKATQKVYIIDDDTIKSGTITEVIPDKDNHLYLINCGIYGQHVRREFMIYATKEDIIKDLP